jgi:hypothetical protein
MQMSVLNSYALEAQQTAVRALYQQAHGQAYAVGEYQMDKLGDPKLILLPSPMGLTEQAWNAIEQRVRGGATLLVTGPFVGDAHFHPTHRQDEVGLHYTTEPLGLREQRVRWPGGDDLYTFGGQLTTVLMNGRLDDGKIGMKAPLGKGNILPLELGGKSASARPRVLLCDAEGEGFDGLHNCPERSRAFDLSDVLSGHDPLCSYIRNTRARGCVSRHPQRERVFGSVGRQTGSSPFGRS